MLEDVVCPVYDKEEESALHILCTCDFAKSRWQFSELGWWFENAGNIKEWLGILFT